MRRLLPLLLALLPAPYASAQDVMWVANRFSSDLHRVSPCGEVLSVANIGTNLRQVKVAPDGKLWVIKFIQPTFDIRNPDGSLFTTVNAALGNPFDVAFDASGDAWVSGGSGVQQFDANGMPVATFPLATAAPLGITIDIFGNKWIAHRVAPPGSISRIDAVTGNVTNHTLPASSNIQPVSVVADARLAGPDSHIWVIGDGGGTLAEFDSAGNALNSYSLGGSGYGSIMVDQNGDLWIGNFSNGQLLQVSPAGAVLNTYSSAPAVNGVNFDGFGRLWVTSRVSFSGPTPSEVRRLDPATGMLEVPTQVGLGTQSALSTRWHHALVVDLTGDADGDTVPNITEILNGTSPYDPQSNTFTSLLADGPTSIGSTFTVTGQGASGALVQVAVSTAALDPGVPLPGLGTLLLDPGTLVANPATPPFLFAGPAPFGLSVTLPNDPAIVGTVLHSQALTSTATQAALSNATCIVIW